MRESCGQALVYRAVPSPGMSPLFISKPHLQVRRKSLHPSFRLQLSSINMTSFSEEKGKVDTLERIDSDSSAAINEQRLNAFTPEEQKKILRKVDYRLIPVLGCMYCVSLMDRTNLGVAMVAGMGVDLKLTGERYSLIVLLFFITYVALQPPATVVLRKVGPRIFLPSIVVIWGAVMIGFGFVKEWHTLLPLRLILGVFEAGFFPGKSNRSLFLSLV
jgi:hypothetical protein